MQMNAKFVQDKNRTSTTMGSSFRRAPPVMGGVSQFSAEVTEIVSHSPTGGEARWLFREIRAMYGQVLTEPLPEDMTELLAMLSDRQPE